MKAKRRSFGRPYGKGRGHSYSHYYNVMRLPEDAVCEMAHLGGCEGPLEKDHIVPHGWGGADTPENIRPLCRRHNRKRGGEMHRIRRFSR